MIAEDLRTSKTVLVITGPTAVGKTEVAIEIARRVPARLISMDSALVYRGMDIGTAKPAPELLAAHPHALVNIRDPGEPYSVAEFVRDADAEVQRARAAHRLPVIVGGTMLYLRAFREGIAQLPEAMRLVVVLHDLQGLTHEQICGMIDESAVVVRKRYSRALVKLREILQDVLE